MAMPSHDAQMSITRMKEWIMFPVQSVFRRAEFVTQQSTRDVNNPQT